MWQSFQADKLSQLEFNIYIMKQLLVIHSYCLSTGSLPRSVKGMYLCWEGINQSCGKETAWKTFTSIMLEGEQQMMQGMTKRKDGLMLKSVRCPPGDVDSAHACHTGQSLKLNFSKMLPIVRASFSSSQLETWEFEFQQCWELLPDWGKKKWASRLRRATRCWLLWESTDLGKTPHQKSSVPLSATYRMMNTIPLPSQTCRDVS